MVHRRSHPPTLLRADHSFPHSPSLSLCCAFNARHHAAQIKAWVASAVKLVQDGGYDGMTFDYESPLRWQDPNVDTYVDVINATRASANPPRHGTHPGWCSLRACVCVCEGTREKCGVCALCVLCCVCVCVVCVCLCVPCSLVRLLQQQPPSCSPPDEHHCHCHCTATPTTTVLRHCASWRPASPGCPSQSRPQISSIHLRCMVAR